MKKPQQPYLLELMKTVLLNPEDPKDPEEIQQVRRMLTKSPSKFMTEMASLERQWAKQQSDWETEQSQARKQRLQMEQQTLTSTPSTSSEETDEGSDRARGLAIRLLKELRDKEGWKT